MWLVTTFGFFSAVEKPDDRGTPFLTVRARVRGDLVNLIKKARGRKPRILDDRRGDYRYRVRIKRGVLARIISDELLSLDYQNFKNEVRFLQGPQREEVYHRVWADLSVLQPTRPYSGATPRLGPFYSLWPEERAA